MLLRSVAVTDLAQAWPIAEPWLDAACRRPGCDLTVADLLDLCRRGEAQLVLIHPHEGEAIAAGVTQVRDVDDVGRSCWALALGGKRAGPWADVIARIEAGAATTGCTSVEFIGRRAWTRLLPEYTAEPCETGIHFSKHW